MRLMRRESILGTIGRRELKSGDLRDRISLIGRFQRAGQQVFLFDWLRCQLRINTGRTEKQKFLRTMAPRRVNHIGLNREIVVQELGWASRVCQNPADFRCRQKYKLGPVFEEELVYGCLITKIKLGVAANQNVAAT